MISTMVHTATVPPRSRASSLAPRRPPMPCASSSIGAWVASQLNWLSIEPLPGYAPDLNPIERSGAT